MATATIIPEILRAAADAAESDLRSAAYAANYLGVREQTLAAWRSSGRYGLPFIKVGRLVKYNQADLDAFIEANTQTQTV